MGVAPPAAYPNPLGNVTAVTDNNGNAVTYSYDYLGQLVGETNSEGSYTITYDERGNITQKDGINYIYGNASQKTGKTGDGSLSDD